MLAQEQIKIFLIFIFVGIIISLIFDIFRILRKVYKFSNVLIYLQDILFWLLTGIIILHSIFEYNSGSIRIYLFFSMFIGIIIYTCTISQYILNIGVYMLKLINKIIILLIVPFNKIHLLIKKLCNNISIMVKKSVKKT